MKPIETYDEAMSVALQEAYASFREGNLGFGAVVVCDGEIIAGAHDSGRMEEDPTAHAEINAIRNAATQLGGNLSACRLVSTHEPCPMCSGAVVWSRISQVAYGVSIAESIAAGLDMTNLPCTEVFRRSGASVKVVGGVNREECRKLYEPQVRALVRRFRPATDSDWEKMEQELLAERREWLSKNRQRIERLRGNDLQRAHALVLDKIDIDPSEAPIIKQTPRQIVFHSSNYCPTLEACKILGLDTRVVCKRVNERPTEELIRKINPKLRFTRRYEHLRPYSDYCEEIIYLDQD